jgi:ribosomal protein S12 methylthiotransferase
MRGRHRSRPPASVLAEIRRFVAEGAKEISLISQDTTYYGMDLWTSKAGPRQPVDSSRGPTLAALLREIETIEGDFWVRLLYTHPAHWSDELMETIAKSRKVARYVDMPLQHIDETMLRRMRRETSRDHIEELIVRLRAVVPAIALRTTFIVGFPGETEAEFDHSSSSSNEFVLSGSGFSNTPRKKVRAPRKCPDRFPRLKKTLASGGP